MISLDDIKKKLDNQNITYKAVEIDDYFNRDIWVVFLGISYKITWYANIAYLIRDGMTVVFDDLKFNGHWPDGFKCHAVFIENGHVNCRVPCEEWGNNG